MALRTKAQLRQLIDSRIPDNVLEEITPAKHREILNDLVDSLAEVGSMPVYLVTGPTYDAATRRLTLVGLSVLTIPAFVFVKLPALPRDSNAVTVRVAGIDETLTDIHGDDVSSALLTPGALVGMVRYAGAARLTEPLLPRPQDYAIVCAVSVDAILTEAEVLTGSVSPVDSGDFLFPVWAASSFVFLGVPADARDITRVSISGSPVNNVGLYWMTNFTVNYDGIAYKWIRSSRAQGSALSGRALSVGTEPIG